MVHQFNRAQRIKLPFYFWNRVAHTTNSFDCYIQTLYAEPAQRKFIREFHEVIHRRKKSKIFCNVRKHRVSTLRAGNS